MTLSLKEVEYVAHLARLAIAPHDIDRYARELSNILDFVNQLSDVDTAQVTPQSHPLDVTQRTRTDTVTEVDQHTLFQSIAPAVESGFYLVPLVIEEE